MSSLVEELQRDALNPDSRVSDLLRKAKTIAVKLDLPELAAWVELEINGYDAVSKIPSYRIVKGRLQGLNPFHGWQPVIFEDETTEDIFSKQPIGQKVAELEHVNDQNLSGLMVPLGSQAKQHIMNATGMEMDYRVLVSASGPAGILDAVRNVLLDWSLKLEKSGIRGEGMSFSNEERKKAHETPATIHIGNIGTFTGNVGSVSGDFNLEGNAINADAKGAISDLARQIKENQDALGLSPAAKATLNSDLDGLNQELSTAKPEASKVRGFLASIQTIAEGAAKSLLTQGILFELSKLKF